MGAVDLALGGHNALSGEGWSERYADGSHGQARHFVGVAAAVTRWGAPFTRWVSVHVRRDAPHSSDGRLTEAALEFADGVLSGRLPVPAALAWICTRLCDGAAD
jgi:hypothetical protein